MRPSHLRKDDWTYKWEGEAPAELHHSRARQEPRPPVRPMLAPGMRQPLQVPLSGSRDPVGVGDVEDPSEDVS